MRKAIYRLAHDCIDLNKTTSTVKVNSYSNKFVFLDGQANAPHIKMLSSDMIIGEPILLDCNVEDSNPWPVLNWNYHFSGSRIESKVNVPINNVIDLTSVM